MLADFGLQHLDGEGLARDFLVGGSIDDANAALSQHVLEKVAIAEDAAGCDGAIAGQKTWFDPDGFRVRLLNECADLRYVVVRRTRHPGVAGIAPRIVGDSSGHRVTIVT